VVKDKEVTMPTKEVKELQQTKMVAMDVLGVITNGNLEEELAKLSINTSM